MGALYKSPGRTSSGECGAEEDWDLLYGNHKVKRKGCEPEDQVPRLETTPVPRSEIWLWCPQKAQPSCGHADPPFWRQGSDCIQLLTQTASLKGYHFFLYTSISYQDELWFLLNKYPFFLSSLPVMLRITMLRFYSPRTGFLNLINFVTNKSSNNSSFGGGWVPCKL